MAEKKVSKPETVARAARLTDEERAKIRQRAQEAVAEERKKADMAAALDIAMREERIAAGLETEDPSWETVTLVLDLAQTQFPCLTIDGKAYHHGVRYEVTKDVAQTLIAMQADGWTNMHREQGQWIPPRSMVKPTTHFANGDRVERLR